MAKTNFNTNYGNDALFNSIAMASNQCKYQRGIWPNQLYNIGRITSYSVQYILSIQPPI